MTTEVTLKILSLLPVTQLGLLGSCRKRMLSTMHMQSSHFPLHTELLKQLSTVAFLLKTFTHYRNASHILKHLTA